VAKWLAGVGGSNLPQTPTSRPGGKVGFMRSCGAILGEDGAHLYRFVFMAAQELLWTACRWRNDIEKPGPGKVDFAQAERELDVTVKSLDIRLAPPVVDGRPIDPRDNPDWFKMPGVVQVDMAEQLRVSRAGVFSALGFSEKSAHEVVQRLGEATLEAVRWLALQTAQDYFLSPASALRTERQGLGPISAAEKNRLEADCLWEAENAWERTKAQDGDGTTPPTPAQPQGTATGTKPRGKKPEAEKAIHIYVVERQSYYDSLKPLCQQNDAVALKQAKKTFGRNVLARKLKLSLGMVTATKAYKKIKAELSSASPRDALTSLRHSGKKVGFDIAEECAGQAAGDTTYDSVEHNETLELLRAANMPTETEQQIISQLQAGAINDATAREWIENFREGEKNLQLDLKADRKPRQRPKTRDSDR